VWTLGGDATVNREGTEKQCESTKYECRSRRENSSSEGEACRLITERGETVHACQRRTYRRDAPGGESPARRDRAAPLDLASEEPARLNQLFC